ncbi:MAG: 23S rRNA (pseudouridine(1915)-N(3))-methyltransferase RlmH [Clostridiales bacterium]|nr:23S rRNA (pseudouridine(1915)-N(3))-methyltransferase RlmH [Clostridiales bacterium]MDR2713003.1 23S rRNA (pseudouridine(1915)-N(3))-methyltransferase RlmH [Clostridiales bacterium]
MQITIIAVGKLKEKYLREGIAEYTKRLLPLTRLNTIEIAEENMVNISISQLLTREGQRILQALSPDAYQIALDIEGQSLSSTQLAQVLADKSLAGQSHFTFIIGGSWGLDKKVLDLADLRLSFGRLTYPHQLMRLILLEQIYRVLKINRGETYHK